MYRKNSGQEAIEFILISALVLFACIFALTIFGGQIAAFFQQNPAATDKEVVVYNEGSNLQPVPGSTGVLPSGGVEITLPTGDGGSSTITIPDTTNYIQTTGSDGDTLSSLADLVDIYGDIIGDLASDENSNANLTRLASLIKQIGDLQSQLYPTYQIDEENQKKWLTDLDPTDINAMSTVNSFLDSLSITFDQMQNTGSTDSAYTNIFIGTENPLTNPASYEQIAYARELQQALADVNNDTSISPEIKQIVDLMVDQVNTISNNTSYVIDNDLYNSKITELNTITTSLTSLSLAPLPVELSVVPLDSAPISDKVHYIKNLCTAINDDSDLLNSLPEGQRETIIEIAKTINIQINQPPESVLNMGLAEQAACIADPSSCS